MYLNLSLARYFVPSWQPTDGTLRLGYIYIRASYLIEREIHRTPLDTILEFSRRR